ncbi:hypothetical protein DMC47_27580 [Nostoc sp. 3335mG]|nr:hypothetical protein DMC47_27580 [Nostoc sp. 3335mG]
MTLILTATASAASLVLPNERYGNAEGCAFLETGALDGDTLRYLKRDELSSYGSGCSIVEVHADAAGNQRAEGICHYEGEDMLGAEDFVVAAPRPDGAIRIYTAAGEIWGELEPCS